MVGIMGSAARLYINDFDLSGYAEEVGQQIERAIAEHTPLNATVSNRAAGIKSVSLNVGGSAYAPAAGGNDAFHWSALAAAESLTYAFVPGGDALGLHAYCGTVRQNNATISAPGDDFVRVPFALLGNARLDRAVILRAMAAGGTSPGTSVNNLALTTAGGRGFLLCPALSAGATLTVLIQDSADGTTDWQTILSFTALTAKGSQAVEIAGAVRQYVRVSWTLTGTTPAATWFCAFSRF